ncbi:hypothetical protein C8A00DRAFT_47097 [Chaetomidium leptoderma]|uniref:HNH nuclease domain-containing protein n=1 Tax=Chaetomidium leptoderma TaxID=669021 RepID=A0AAN6VFK1_9PEZI|nr:hypothetical protein C8A00DRAFT_47097 [Chaetomidium leptoderma]
MEQAVEKLGAEGVDKILAAAMADPKAMFRFASDISPPAEPVQDYITEVDARRALFDEFRAICQPYYMDAPNATILALFMVAPLSEIRTLLQTIRETRLQPARHFAASVPTAILNEPGTPAPSDSVTRGQFSHQVKERDGHICVFSGMSDPAAAHIFPFATSKNRNFAYLNEMLAYFWDSKTSFTWRRMFESPAITQSAKNGISMSHQIHFWFDNARFALKPLRETPEGVVVQWHWLKRSILKPLVYVHPDHDILLQAGVTDHGQNWGDNLAHRKSGVTIRTGQTFLLRAEKPEDMPSWDLLEMQWNLLRIAAISGAADVTDDYYYDYTEPDERGYDQTVAAKQRAILAEHQ